MNPTTGVRRYTIGGPACVIAGSPSPAGAVCENRTFDVATILDWTDVQTGGFPIGGPTSAYLSPDGQHVAVVSGSSTTIFRTNTTLDLLACGWIDATHVIAAGDTQQQARVGDIASGSLTPVPAQGSCGGRIPGGL